MRAWLLPDVPLATLARRHLPAAVADEWIALIRPALHLRPAESGEPEVARLGGLPALPEHVTWPLWEGHGPLSFVASIDCERLPSDALDIALPAEGILLFFYRHSRWEDGTVIESSAPETQAGARVVYLPPGTQTAEREPPESTNPYPLVRLAADVIASGPDWEHPALRAALDRVSDEDRAFMDDPMNSDPFRMAMGEVNLELGPQHRVGGYADPIQGSVEVDVARAQLGGRVAYDDPALHEEAQRWTLLAQIDSDDNADMVWGDRGALYWLIRRKDLAAERWQAASFTWQCY
ncbi:DUF1963 domain-containing protein [Micromonospora musae]|uniref:DUF1963 domain-containing protein n=2 Tax=Micromonospora musae TaxID=1894970 RepID=A0A3A9XV55_9ACTN|nr:DUF1963 domain-containing protein [Micromonospora musae]